jgi:hypothetical protein
MTHAPSRRLKRSRNDYQPSICNEIPSLPANNLLENLARLFRRRTPGVRHRPFGFRRGRSLK